MADGAGVRATDTPSDLRSAAVLSPNQAAELARTGLAIEKLYGQPMDIEWALAGGEVSVVQARPITTAPGSGERWNDSLDGDFLWSNGNLGEALPGRHDARHLVVHATVHDADDRSRRACPVTVVTGGSAGASTRT